MASAIPAFKDIVIYTGHDGFRGPYQDRIKKRVAMFKELYPGKVMTVAGEDLVGILKGLDLLSTLLVIPPGESTDLDKVFSPEEIAFLMECFKKGMRGYVTCGSAYWVSKTRIYRGLCKVQPSDTTSIVKESVLPLFQGTADGPLCPFPAAQYKVGFYSAAVSVSDGTNECNIFLGGGGSFLPHADEKVKVLAKYTLAELEKRNKTKEWENAAIMVPVGLGGVILSMFHPYYDSTDINVELYEQTFPNCGTNWREVHAKLSPHEVRMAFVYKMLRQLEELAF